MSWAMLAGGVYRWLGWDLWDCGIVERGTFEGWRKRLRERYGVRWRIEDGVCGTCRESRLLCKLRRTQAPGSLGYGKRPDAGQVRLTVHEAGTVGESLSISEFVYIDQAMGSNDFEIYPRAFSTIFNT